MPKRQNRTRLSDVAREAGVARQTAGAVLLGGRSNTRVSDETRRRVEEVARRLRYQPNQAARSLRGRSSRLVGLLSWVAAGEAAEDPSHALIETDIVKALVRRGLSPLYALCTDNEGFEQQVNRLVRFGIEGLLVLRDRLDADPEVHRRLLELCPRTVFYQGEPHHPELRPHSVDVDRFLGARLVVRHLLARGRRRIALFPVDLEREGAVTRTAGYFAELKTQGLEADESLVWDSPFIGAGRAAYTDTLRPAISRAIEEIVVRHRADAVLNFVGEVAGTVALVEGLQARGIEIPRQVAVASVRDDPVYEALTPSVTVARLNHHRVAEEMVRMLVSLIDDDTGLSLRQRTLVAPDLVIREST